MQTLSAHYEPSRHDEQMLIAPTIPADPYTTWLEQREAEHRASGIAAPRFTRRRRKSAATHGAGDMYSFDRR